MKSDFQRFAFTKPGDGDCKPAIMGEDLRFQIAPDTLSNVFCDDLNPLIVIESPIHILPCAIRNVVDLRIRPIEWNKQTNHQDA
ncbi:hypothetical protein RISK_003911 [Rhodopirellula islandica]|uniref:Uncharacterized protein n=1 Tax=Rhodopirellula islandica TaxID=595434 RepID=A0A0J1BBD3_RHOIS|nr:hypothetical protein RISK_003911 [Rhodopirellula islandica]